MANNRFLKLLQDSKERFKQLELKPRTYYVAEVAVSSTNIPHRVVLVTGWNDEDKVLLFNHTYEDRATECYLGALSSIQVLTEISEMQKSQEADSK